MLYQQNRETPACDQELLPVLPDMPAGWNHREMADGVILQRDGLNLGPNVACTCVIGAFDGVHLGHRALIQKACDDARMRGLPCVVVTFDPDPAEVIVGIRPLTQLLLSEDRLALLACCGSDALICLKFTPSFAKLPWREFALGALRRYFLPVSVHVGTNFRFGKGGQGDPAALAELGREYGFEVFAHELVASGNEVVSATRIRHLVRSGALQEANNLLGRLHFVRGTVVRGRGQGGDFGFPTANVEVDAKLCMPAEGVYGGWFISSSTAWPAAVNVGAPPTFTKLKHPSFLEANLVGFKGDLYGSKVAVAFSAYRRSSHPFDSIAALEQTIFRDVSWVQTNIGDHRISCGREV